jgi:hypothetical protein
LWPGPYTPRAYVPLTVIGVVLGAVGWLVARRVAKDPRWCCARHLRERRSALV